MAYTHYWWRPRELDVVLFRRLVRDVKEMLEHLPGHTDSAGGLYRERPLLIRGALGTGQPTVSEEEVAFNGDAAEELDHETFAIERVYRPASWETPDVHNLWFSFCKTARKPYDLLVTASLLMFKQHFGAAVHVSSDGRPEEWEAAHRLVARVFGPDIAHSAWTQIWPKKLR